MSRPSASMGVASLACVLAGCLHDPSAGFSQTKAASRNYQCTRLSQAQAHERFPGVVPELPPRGAYGVTDALVCDRRLIDLGERSGRDEWVLTTLGQSVDEITRAASALAPAQTRWHVDAFYPSAEVAEKIAVAARVSLVERGQQVSDRVPVLAAGDIAVLARMSADRSYQVACGRYFAEHILEPPDAFLGVMIVDAREAQLHAGLCVAGEWRWLQ